MITTVLIGVLLQASPLRDMEYPGFDPELANHVRAVCPLSASTDRGVLRKLEERLANQVRDARSKVTAAQWRDVACARALLAVIDAPASGSHLMTVGASWSTGARDAARRALTLDHGEHAAADLLGSFALGDANLSGKGPLQQYLRELVDSGVTVPAVLRACSDLSLRERDAKSTRLCAETGLSLGKDLTWHHLRLAQQSYREADSSTGVTHFLLAAASATDSASRRAMEWHLQWFLSPTEREAWEHLPDSARGQWVRDRLVERDLRDGRQSGERLATHFARLEFVEANFRLAIPKRLRGKSRTAVSHFFGLSETARQGGIETIVLGENDTILRSTADTMRGREATVQWREYRRWQVDFDDRGVIWMRFGKPDRVALYTPMRGGSALTTWRYEVDGRTMLVHFREVDFDGSSGTTDLAVGILGQWQCGLDSYRCSLTVGGRLSEENAARLRDQDREYLMIGTTKDDNSPRGVRPLLAVGEVSQLWDVTSGAPMTILTYGVKLGDLRVGRDSAGRESARVDLRFRRWLPTSAEWREDSLRSEHTIPSDRTGDTHLTAFRVFPNEGGIASWGITVTQPDGGWGRAYANTAPLSEAAVALSDVIIAPESRGISWVHHGDRIFLSPGGTIRNSEPVRLYYQVRATSALPGSSARLEISRVIRGVIGPTAAIALDFSAPLKEGVNVASRVLDISQLPAGTYQLEIRIIGKGGDIVARRAARFDVE